MIDTNKLIPKRKEGGRSIKTIGNIELIKKDVVKIDSLLKQYSLKDYTVIIKLDVEGNEINVIKGALEAIKKSEPLIIIEFSKYIFGNKKF